MYRIVNKSGDKPPAPWAHQLTKNGHIMIPNPMQSWDYNCWKLPPLQQQQTNCTVTSEGEIIYSSTPTQQQPQYQEIPPSVVLKRQRTKKKSQKQQQYPSNSQLVLTKLPLKNRRSHHSKRKYSKVFSSDQDISANPVNRQMDHFKNQFSGNNILSTTASHVSAFRPPLPRAVGVTEMWPKWPRPQKPNIHQGILSSILRSQMSHLMLNSHFHMTHLMNTTQKSGSTHTGQMGSSYLNSLKNGGAAMIETEAASLNSSDPLRSVTIPQQEVSKKSHKKHGKHQNKQQPHQLQPPRINPHWGLANGNQTLKNPNDATHFQPMSFPFVKPTLPPQSYKPKRSNTRIPLVSKNCKREQVRRFTLNAGYDTLRSLHPQLNNKYVFKLNILHQSSEFIKKTKLEVSQLNEDIEAKRKEVSALNSEIKNYQSILSASGAPISCEIENKMEEIYFQWVRYRTTENWKFWVFSIVILPLFFSYNESVSTASLSEMQETMLNWVNKSFAIEELKSKVLESLQHLSSKTGILTNPRNLQQEAYKAVDWTPPINSETEVQQSSAK